jgi:hypothetical protein
MAQRRPIRRRLLWRAIAAACGVVAAGPSAAETWNEFVAALGPAEPPAAVRAYLAQHPLVRAAPKPTFHEIRTETADGALKQRLQLTGFDDGFSTLEGAREERVHMGTGGPQTVTMVTALGGLLLVSLDNKTTGATVSLRKVELGGELLPPATGRALTVKYERVQRLGEAVVEEARDCLVTWSQPAADAPVLESHCTGSVKTSQRKPDGGVASATATNRLNATLVFRRDLGWIFDQHTRVVDVKR